jgi:hypothetical protein
MLLECFHVQVTDEPTFVNALIKLVLFVRLEWLNSA